MNTNSTSNQIQVPLGKYPVKRKELIWIAVGIALLYLSTVSAKWWPTPDSALFIVVADSIHSGQGMTYNGKIANHVGPGFPLMLSAVRSLFGDSAVAMHLLVAIFAVVGLGLSYATLRKLESSRLVIAAVLTTALSYGFFANKGRVLTDIPYFAFFWGVLYCVIRANYGSWFWYILTGFLSATAVLVRMPGFIPLSAVAFGLCFDKRFSTSMKGRISNAVSIGFPTVIAITGFWFWSRSVLNGTDIYSKTHIQHLGKRLVYFLRIDLMLGYFANTWCEILTSQDGGILTILMLPTVLVLLIGLVKYWRTGSSCGPPPGYRNAASSVMEG